MIMNITMSVIAVILFLGLSLFLVRKFISRTLYILTLEHTELLVKVASAKEEEERHLLVLTMGRKNVELSSTANFATGWVVAFAIIVDVVVVYFFL